MSKYDTDKIKTFDNEVVVDELTSALITSLDANTLITVDYSLQAEPGMVYKVRKYMGTGNVQDLAMGEGNTESIGASFVETPYEVKTTQGMSEYYDEQLMNDPSAIDQAVQQLKDQMTNDITTKVVAELEKGSHKVYNFDYSFEAIVDAMAMLPEEHNEGLYLLVARKDGSKIQKKLKDTLQYVEAFARSGYIGSVAGVPVILTDAVETGHAYLATRDAVWCFVKKGLELENKRDANVRKNTLFARNVKVIALKNDNKVIVLSAAAA